MPTVIPSGRFFWNSASTLRTCLATATALAPRCFLIADALRRHAVDARMRRTSSKPSSTSATSLR